jgi:hypothetical protein
VRKTALLTIVLATSATLFAAKAQRDWKVGTLLETDHVREPQQPASTNVYVSPSPYPNLNFNRVPTTWQGFRIEGNGYRLLVMCPVRRNHTPNVTVNGPLKYSMDKGKFYLLDEDGKEWEMTVLEKALIPPPAPPAK